MGALFYFLLLLWLTTANDSPLLRGVRAGSRQTRKLLTVLLGTFFIEVQIHLPGE